MPVEPCEAAAVGLVPIVGGAAAPAIALAAPTSSGSENIRPLSSQLLLDAVTGGWMRRRGAGRLVQQRVREQRGSAMVLGRKCTNQRLMQ